MDRPVIGITVDNQGNSADTGTYESAIRYSDAVTRAGGLAVLLPHAVEQAAAYARLCDGLMLTGGADPVMEQFGCATDGRARRIDARRQAFELALLAEVDALAEGLGGAARAVPVLGVCLGMQLMALYRGGTLDQYMPESMGASAAQLHTADNAHELVIEHADSALGDARGSVVSSHRQRITDAGQLRIVARAADGTVEAIDDPGRPYYLGVQWHPERSDSADSEALNLGLIRKLVEAAGKD